MPALNRRAKLIQELCRTAIEEFQPDDGLTYCNYAVNFIARELGYAELGGLLANLMIMHFQNSGDFANIDIDTAHRLADAGNLVVAAKRGNPHGHVATLYPGRKMILSRKWGKKVPFVANIGSRNGIMGCNYAFEFEPKFWVLIEDVHQD